MKKLINYLFPNDWYDVETINVTHHSSLTGTPEILGKRIIPCGIEEGGEE